MLKQKGFQGEKLEAAYLLLVEQSTTADKVEKIRLLLKGLDPSVDQVLTKFSKSFLAIDKLSKGEVLSLSAEGLPETTEKEKKRKKTLLLFFSYWRSLKNEVARVREIYASDKSDNSTNQESPTENVEKAGRVAAFAKGPLGLVTLTAVLIVGALGYLKLASVNVAVKNDGCTPFDSKVRMPFKIPGLVLPEKSIASGEEGQLSLPPLKFEVDGTSNESLSLSVLRYNMAFNIRNVKSINLNGKNLLGTKGEVNLGSSKNHALVISCN